MAKTEVTLINNNGVYVPSTDSVPVVAGDAVSFATSDGSTAFAFFSPDAISVLSPRPAIPFPIASGHNGELTFSSSKPGAYAAFFGSDPNTTPASFPHQASGALRFEISLPLEPPPFSGGGDQMTRGH
jgi:hypothetical protein